MTKKVFIMASAAAAIIAVFLFTQRVAIKEYFIEGGRPELPAPIAYEDIRQEKAQNPAVPNSEDEPENPRPEPVPEPEPDPEPIPQPTPQQSINLAVPFQPQASFADWSLPYKEACEEASLIMVDHYLRGVELAKQEMKDETDAQVAWQTEQWGGHFDLSVDKVRELAEVFYPSYSFTVISPLTIDAIRRELSRGRPVIIPAAGRELGNPYFRSPGPLYHMLVIRGITADGRFITNDPGTRRGEAYLYDSEILLAAARDWDGDSPDGPSRGFTMYPKTNNR